MTVANLKNVSINLFYAVNKLGAELIFSGMAEEKKLPFCMEYSNSFTFLKKHNVLSGNQPVNT